MSGLAHTCTVKHKEVAYSHYITVLSGPKTCLAAAVDSGDAAEDSVSGFEWAQISVAGDTTGSYIRFIVTVCL